MLDYEHGRPWQVQVDNRRYRPDRPTFIRSNRQEDVPNEEEMVDRTIIEQKGNPSPGSQVVVGRYTLSREGHRVVYYLVQPASSRGWPGCAAGGVSAGARVQQ